MSIGVHWMFARANRSREAPLDASHASPFDTDAMTRALALARAGARAGEVPVGAVVYRLRDGAILGTSANATDSRKDPTAHAEVLAIRQAAQTTGDWRLADCGLVVTLEPCAMCAGAIVLARLGRVVYGTPDPKAGFVGSLGNLLHDPRLNHRVRAVAGVQQQACSQLLTSFFRQRRSR